MTIADGGFRIGQGRSRVPALLVSVALIGASAVSTASAGIYHYPWCETVRDRCYAKAKVRKAECNWRYNAAKHDQVNGLSRWPVGISNFCRMYPDSH